MTDTSGKPEGCVELVPFVNLGRWEPQKARRGDQITPSLLQPMRDCCAGKLPWPLAMIGDAGAGKTCAALVILDHYQGRYHTANGLADELNEARFGRLQYSSGYNRTTLEIWKEIKEATVFVLDELGSKKNVSDAHFDTVKEVMEKRHGKPTIYITNLTIAEIAGCYDDRIASRLQEGTVVDVQGDRRMDK